MKIVWQIEPEDAAKVKEFFERHCDDPLVKRRIETNLNHAKPPVAKEAFWECMIACLLTTQQRSDPESPVTRFLRTQPFPLRYAVCREQSDPAGEESDARPWAEPVRDTH